MTRVLGDPFRAEYMLRALVEMLLLAVLAGVVGVHVILRRMAFIGDALTHTVFPGVVVAFALGQSIFLGALVAGLLSALLLTGLTANRRVTFDAGLAVVLTTFFAFGVVVVSRTESYTSNLTGFLFGRILAVSWAQIVETAVVAAVVVAVVVALHKELVFRAFDQEASEAAGYHGLWLDLALNAMTAMVVVAAVKAVGTVLVLALIVTPAAAARLLTDRVGHMLAWSCLIGIVGGYLGLVFSYEASIRHGVRLASGATIVLGVTALFAVAAIASPRSGVPALIRRRRAVP